MELLQEGIGQVQASVSSQRRQQPLAPQQQKQLSLQQVVSQRQASVPPSLRDAIKREAGGNKVMESIFADTAKTTLPAQLRSESSKIISPAGTVEAIVENHNPEDIFGEEVSSKWATLAFSEPSKK